MEPTHISYLLEKQLAGTSTEQEREELINLASSPEADQYLPELIISQLQKHEPDTEKISPETAKAAVKNILAIDKGKINISTLQKNEPRVLYPNKWRYIAAAILILAIGSGVYYFNNQSSTSNAIKGGTGETRGAVGDVAPGTNRAILTLSNGIQKQLSLADNGLQLQSDAVLLTTPNGGQYQAVLPDGSKVWLNAASSIKFSSKLNKERRVEVTGEVYFEVAKNKDSPFFVQTGDQQIEVLGTAFNVNAYKEESATKTTLVQGAVKIGQKILKPGDAYYKEQIIKTDIQQDIAWKDGLFDFNNKSMEEAMRQVARWYDIEIQFDGPVSSVILFGKADRNLSLQDLVQGYDGAIGLFKLEGKVLHIKPLQKK